MKILFLLIAFQVFGHLEKVYYPLTSEPIDVVIPCHSKDRPTLKYCIQGIRENIENVRRIVVVSKEKMTNLAEWFDEAKYPFTKKDIAYQITRDEEAAHKLLKKGRVGWVYQQLLKLYAPLVIDGISSNVLIVDSDAMFVNSTRIMDPWGHGYYNPASEYHMPYFKHMNRLIPGLTRVNKKYSGVAHHMLFQRPVIENLFQTIRSIHNTKPWKAICRCIDKKTLDMSEYEIYFNFLLTTGYDQMQIRPLEWKNAADGVKNLSIYKAEGYNYVCQHTYMLPKSK